MTRHAVSPVIIFIVSVSSRKMAENAFDILLQLLRKEDRMIWSTCNGSKKVNDLVPLCLREITETTWPPHHRHPCLICGKLFKVVGDLLSHSTSHRFNLGDDDTEVEIYCCFCGMALPSTTALCLHQTLGIPLLMCCPGCEKFFKKEDFATHICKTTKNHRQEKDLDFCPLGCEKQHLSDKETLKNHLKFAHGCNEDDVRGADCQTVCPLCHQVYHHPDDESHVSLQSHMTFYCPSVGELQKAFARQMLSLVKKEDNKLNWELIFNQQLEATLFHVLSQAVSISKSRNDEDVEFLTFVIHRVKDFKFKDFLIQAESLSSSYSIVEAFDDFKGDFALLFRLWCATLDHSIFGQRKKSLLGLPSLVALHDLTLNGNNEHVLDEHVKRVGRNNEDEKRPNTETMARILKELQIYR